MTAADGGAGERDTHEPGHAEALRHILCAATRCATLIGGGQGDCSKRGCRLPCFDGIAAYTALGSWEQWPEVCTHMLNDEEEGEMRT